MLHPISHRRESATTSPGTVLVIDDDEVTTDAFARMLRLEGFQVRTALTAERGLLEAEKVTPDAVILDLHMPLVDGLGFLYRFRAREEHRDTPVAIVTGDYAIADPVMHELTRLGAQLHFKPLWLDDLLDLTHSMLNAGRRPSGSAALTLN